MFIKKRIHNLKRNLTLFRSSRQKYPLREISLAVTEDCGLACSFCYTPKKDHYKIDEAVFKRLIDHGKKVGLVTLEFCGGEPTTHPSIIPFIEYSYMQGVRPRIATNGMHIDKELAGIFYKYCSKVKMSLESVDADIEDSLVGRVGAHARKMQSFEYLLSAGLANDRRITVITCGLKKNQSTLEETFEWARNRNIEIQLNPTHPVGRCKPEDVLKGYELKEFMEKARRYNGRPDIRVIGPSIGTVCIDGKGAAKCYINYDGGVHPCCFALEINAGNINSQTIDVIWRNASVFDDFAKSSRHENLEGRCKECSEERCVGCRGVAKTLYGRYTAEDTLCWK